MAMATVHVFKNGTNLRLSGLLQSSNIIGTVDKGDYEAQHQCVGDRVTEGSVTNVWWVKIKAGSKQGWVSAARISSGDNNDPIPGIPTQEVEWA
jgi:hypothetical protein